MPDQAVISQVMARRTAQARWGKKNQEAGGVASRQQTGMRGVFLVAAELSGRGFIVSVTSRNALGADLLVTDQKCKQAWSVQVKTSSDPTKYWLVGERAETVKSRSHIYVFVGLWTEPPEYHVVTSEFVAAHVHKDECKSGTLCSFDPSDPKPDFEGWELFGDSLDPKGAEADGPSAAE
jgi:hypothetical protein